MSKKKIMRADGPPRDDPDGDCTPLVRGLNFPDSRMPVGLRMSEPLARWLMAVLSEKKRVTGRLFISCLEQAMARIPEEYSDDE